MNGRLIAAAVGVAALGWVAVTLLGDAAADSEDSADGDRAASPTWSSSDAAGDRPDRRAAPIASDRFPGDRSMAAPEERAAPEPEVLRGRVIAVDPSGAELATLDGELVLRFFDEAWGEATELLVRRGEWSCAAGAYTQVEVVKCALGGRPVYFEHRHRHQDRPPQPFLELRGTRGAAVTLQVVDGETGADLTDVSVFRNGHWAAWTTNHPGDLKDTVPMIRGAASPLTLDPPEVLGDPKAQCWVIAPGYAWGKLGLDHTSGGDRKVTLVAGGALEVVVGAGASGKDALLCLRPAGNRPDGVSLTVSAAAKGTTLLGGVRVGSYELTLEKGGRFDDRAVLGAASVVVRRGQTTTVHLDTRDAPAGPPRVSVRGTLTLPQAWPRQGVILYLIGAGETKAWVPKPAKTPLSAMAVVSGSPERYRWSLENVLAGTYKVVVAPMGVIVPVTVSEAGEGNLDIVVPPPAEVAVTVREGGTGALLDATQVQLRVMNESPGPGGFSPVRPGADGRFHLRVPVGRMQLSVDMEGYDWEVVQREVRHGSNALDIALSPVCGMTFVFKDG